MKINKILFGCLLAASIPLTTFAQFGYYNDALLFSRTQFGGTARMQAIGGSQIALGGDLSVAGSNPAGLGFFNRNVFTVTSSLDFHSSDAVYFGQQSSTFKNNFNFSQIGFAFNQGKGDIVQDKFKGGTFAISINRVNNFNNEYMYDGRNTQNSIVDSFIERAGNAFPDQLGNIIYTAYDHFLIDEADFSDPDDFIIDGNYIRPNIVDGTIEGYSSLFGAYYQSLPRQNEVVRTRGGQYQVDLAWGGNYDDRLYFGGGIGILSVDYAISRNYTESDFRLANGNQDDLLNSINIRDQLTVSGTGINTTVGLIARPVSFITVGLSYVSPSYYALNEEFEFSFATDWNPAYSYIAGSDTIPLSYIRTVSDISQSNYNLKTPSKFNVGTAIFLGKNGFITGDIQILDFSTAQLKSNDFVVTEDNNEIAALYRSVVNYRLGAEVRIDQIMIRGGFAYQADPYANSTIDRSNNRLSFGLGYRNQDFFIDLALANTRFINEYSPYFLTENQPTVDLKMKTTTASLTLGFTF